MIRSYQESDYPVLCTIARKAWSKIFQGYREQLGEDVYSIMNPDPDHCKDQQIRSFVDSTPDKLLVAERNGRTVGFITYFTVLPKGLGYIGNNAVDPDCGEKGVGQEMYQEVFRRMKEEGVRVVQVTTGLDEGHAPARRAYQRAGFNLSTQAVTYVKKL